MICRVALGMTCLIISVCVGCSNESDRVAEVAREAAREQAEQNKRMVQVQQEVAEAHRRLVEEEAKARGETIALQRDLQKAQEDVGAQRDALEAERREIATQRGRDPIIAAAIQVVGIALACLLPLILCIYILRAVQGSNDAAAAVTEILIDDLTSDEPTLLPPFRSLTALKDQTGLDELDEPPIEAPSPYIGDDP